MKNNHVFLRRNLTVILVILFAVSVFAVSPTIGGYNVYFGHLHNHTSYSDGQGTPAQAYTTAKANGLDFLGLSDHSHLLTDAEWTTTLVEADNYNQENVFTTFRGFEWTSGTLGHVTVVNTPSFITTSSPYETFGKLCAWLETQDCIAFFNHPGYYNSTGLEFSHFTGVPVTEKIVGMEFWNKTDGFSKFYYNTSNGTSVAGYYAGDGMAFYDEALQRGWKIGAQGSEDNHVASWGNLTFNPVKDFNGNTTPVYYTVHDNRGAVSNEAAIDLYVTPVEDVQTIFFTVNSSKQIVVTCYDKIIKGAKISVYSTTSGKLVASATMKSQTTTIKTKLSAGYYTVKVVNGGVVTSGSVLVN